MGKKKQTTPKDPKKVRQQQVLLGGAFILFAVLFTLAFLSYLLYWKEDFSTLNAFTDSQVTAQNILNKVGAYVSHLFIYQGIGISAFFVSLPIGKDRSVPFF